jgi:hypothetical protein
MDGTITPGASGNTAAGACGSGVSTEMWNNGTTGKRNSSLDFDGADDYVDMNDVLDIPNSTSPFSVSAWVKRDSSTSHDVILAKTDDYTSLNDGYNLVITSGDNVIFGAADGANSCNSTGPIQITDSNWYHIVAVFTTSGCTTYINGLAGTTSSYSGGGPDDNALDFKIGSESDGEHPFDGQIDEVKIFYYPLTPYQVKLDYNQGAVRFGPDSGQP